MHRIVNPSINRWPARWVLTLALVTLGLAFVPFARSEEPQAPKSIFLVAKRGMPDPNFREAVVLVTQHAHTGPVGVIINRATDMLLSSVFPRNDTLQQSKESLRFGGPISRAQLTYVFRAPKKPKSAIEVLPEIYMSFDEAKLVDLLARPEPTKDLRVFSGYAGWSAKQLAAEVARGDWHVIMVDEKAIFNMEPAMVWPALIQRVTARSV